MKSQHADKNFHIADNTKERSRVSCYKRLHGGSKDRGVVRGGKVQDHLALPLRGGRLILQRVLDS